MKLVKEDGNTTKEHQETRNFLVESMVRHILFGKQEIGKVEGELKELMSLLDFQLDSMPGIDLVTASALIAEIGDVRRFPNAKQIGTICGHSACLLWLWWERQGTKKQTGKSGAACVILQPSSPASASSKRK